MTDDDELINSPKPNQWKQVKKISEVTPSVLKSLTTMVQPLHVYYTLLIAKVPSVLHINIMVHKFDHK